MGRRPRFGEAGGAQRRGRLLEQAVADLDPQDPPHRILQPGRRDVARLHPPDGILKQPPPVGGGHEHVEPGGHRSWATARGATRQRGMAVPVAQQDAVEAHPILQHPGQQPVMAMQGSAVP